MKVYLLWETDAHHAQLSKRLLEVFFHSHKIPLYLKDRETNSEKVAQLSAFNQTQGFDTNYMLEEREVL